MPVTTSTTSSSAENGICGDEDTTPFVDIELGRVPSTSSSEDDGGDAGGGDKEGWVSRHVAKVGVPNTTPGHDAVSVVTTHVHGARDPITLVTRYLRVAQRVARPYVSTGATFVCAHVWAFVHGGVLASFGALGILMARKIHSLERDIDYLIEHSTPGE